MKKLLVLLLLFLTTPSYASYAYKRSLTIDHTKVPATQTNFTVLVSLTNVSLKTSANGGRLNNSAGFDLAFFSDSGLTSAINCQQETYGATTGTIVYWVSIASISSSTDTVFWMGYGDSSIGTAQCAATGTWNTNFKAVWHLGDGTTLSGADATSNANTGTLVNTPTATTGKIDGGVAMASASSQYINGGHGSSINFGTGNFTISVWIKTGDGAADRHIIRRDANSTVIYIRTLSTGGDAQCVGTGAVTGSSDLADNAWHHLAQTRNGTTITCFVDGASIGTDTATVDFTGTTEDWFIGSNPTPAEFWNGSLDEIHLVGADLGANWITTEFNNQNSPSTFMTLSEQMVATGNLFMPAVLGR